MGALVVIAGADVLVTIGGEGALPVAQPASKQVQRDAINVVSLIGNCTVFSPELETTTAIYKRLRGPHNYLVFELGLKIRCH